jgi:predicted acylesterase/phospholipase RssA
LEILEGAMTSADPQAQSVEAPDAGTKAIAGITAADFQDPLQLCDVVMKGGITSGIVYPPAILRIAQRFRLKRIGGTSAGAIAAAVAAAAEFRRASSGSGEGYMKLKTQVMDWLAEGKNLQSLFVPVIAAAPVFYFFRWLIGLKSACRRRTAAGVVNLVVASVILAVAVLGFCEALVQRTLPWIGPTAQAVAILLILLGVAVAACVLFLLPRSNYGMCSGGRQSTLPRSAEPLTFWMSRQIDDIACAGAGRPLTFADLWVGRIRSEGELNDAAPAQTVLDLQMVTTCLTMGRPFHLPFDYDLFYFRREEFVRFFPAYVVDWMVAHGREPKAGDAASAARHAFLADLGYLPLPHGGNLPIVVAARMSLSFPMLLSAIRLYAVDYTSPYNVANPEEPQIEAVWFSDGGLSSNFPIGLFDSPLPKWPTLAITLEEFPPGVPQGDPANGAYVATNNNAQIGSIWSRFSQGAVPSNTLGFYGAVVNAMMNWQDTMQSEAPGFRDRIAHVRLTAQQGGLNLTMPPAVIQALLQRGELAGKLLVNHFQVPVPPSPFITSWDNHRWIRVRTTMDSFQRFADDFRDAWQDGTTEDPAYPALVANGMSSPSGAYEFQYQAQVVAAAQLAADVIDAAKVTDSPQASLSSNGAPRPISDLRPRPRF